MEFTRTLMLTKGYCEGKIVLIRGNRSLPQIRMINI